MEKGAIYFIPNYCIIPTYKRRETSKILQLSSAEGYFNCSLDSYFIFSSFTADYLFFI